MPLLCLGMQSRDDSDSKRWTEAGEIDPSGPDESKMERRTITKQTLPRRLKKSGARPSNLI